MSTCSSCGEIRDIRWKICPFCSREYSNTNIDQNKTDYSVRELVKDTAIGGDLHQKITINERSSVSSGCPQCGSQNVPVMVCLSGECNTTFCEFCYKTPWVHLVLADDTSLSAEEFGLIKERTDYGPYCKIHGRQLIDSRIEERKIIVKDMLNSFDNELSQLRLHVKTYNEPVRNAEGNVTYWSSMMDSAESQLQTLSSLKKEFDDSDNKIKSIINEKTAFEKSVNTAATANLYYSLGWLLPFVLIYGISISYKINEPVTILSLFCMSMVGGLMSSFLTDSTGSDLSPNAMTIFLPTTVILCSIGHCLIWTLNPVPSSVNLFESLFLFFFLFVSIIIYFVQMSLGLINLVYKSGYKVQAEYLIGVKSHRLKSSLSYASEIEIERESMSKSLHSYTTFEIRDIIDTKLDPMDRVKSLKSIVDKYKLNLDTWSNNLDHLRRQIALFDSGIRQKENEKNQYITQMFGNSVIEI